jgi:hypothetical protein
MVHKYLNAMGSAKSSLARDWFVERLKNDPEFARKAEVVMSPELDQEYIKKKLEQWLKK